jgi:hypothetical protein
VSFKNILLYMISSVVVKFGLRSLLLLVYNVSSKIAAKQSYLYSQ